MVATYTVSGQTFTREYNLTVAKVVTGEPELVTELEAGVPYKFGLYQANLEKNLWLSGTKSGNYLATVENVDEAATLYLEETTGGYHVAVGKGDAKKYLNVTSYTNSSGEVKQSQDIGDTATSVWTYNADLKTIVTVNADLGTEAYYMGAYSSFNTISSSRISYAATSFVGQLYSIPNPETEVVTTLETGKAYKYEVFQANAEVNKNIYLSGVMSGNFLATTDNYSEAVDVYLEETTGGYYFAVGTGESKLYVNLTTYQSGDQTKSSQKLEATPSSVWTYDSALKTLVTTNAALGTDTYYLGAYNAFTTLSISKTSYAATSYVGHFVNKVGAGTTTPDAGGEQGGQTGGETGGEQGSTTNLASAKTLDFSTTAQRTVLNDNQQVWTDGSVTLTNDKASSTNAVADYSNPVRLYKGSTMTISSSAGKFNKIVINSANYEDRIQALNDTLTAANLTFTANGTVFTITFAEAIDTTTAISLANQCRFVSIVVSYE